MAWQERASLHAMRARERSGTDALHQSSGPRLPQRGCCCFSWDPLLTCLSHPRPGDHLSAQRRWRALPLPPHVPGHRAGSQAAPQGRRPPGRRRSDGDARLGLTGNPLPLLLRGRREVRKVEEPAGDQGRRRDKRASIRGEDRREPFILREGLGSRREGGRGRIEKMRIERGREYRGREELMR
eukprot:764538-Hanusia_phi.AAC.1